jgi:hypothetical protein
LTTERPSGSLVAQYPGKWGDLGRGVSSAASYNEQESLSVTLLHFVSATGISAGRSAERKLCE